MGLTHALCGRPPQSPGGFRGSGSPGRGGGSDEYGKIHRARNTIIAIIASFMLLVFMYGNLQSVQQTAGAPSAAAASTGAASTDAASSAAAAAADKSGQQPSPKEKPKGEPKRKPEPEAGAAAAKGTEPVKPAATPALDWKGSKQWVRETHKTLEPQSTISLSPMS